MIEAGILNDTDIRVPREVCCCKTDLCNKSKESAEASFNGGKGKNNAPTTEEKERNDGENGKNDAPTSEEKERNNGGKKNNEEKGKNDAPTTIFSLAALAAMVAALV